jgi:predicted nucleotidyltransferase
MPKLSLAAAEAMAGRVLASRYPDADAVWLTGSHARGDATPGSDLDLIVLYAKLPRSRRESLTIEETPVEVFIHDPETLAWSLNADIEAGKPGMHSMVSEGRILGPRPAAAERLQARARARLAAGPPPFTPEQVDLYRYHITDRLIDLRDERDAAEVVAIGVWLYLSLAELMLRGRGRWMGTGKWIPRHLRALDPALERRFSEAFEALFTRRDPALVIALADAEMAPHGGPLFDGYESSSAEAARLPEAPEAG